MIEQISHKITTKIINISSPNKSNEQDMIQYGIECLINTCIPITTIFLFALIKKALIEAVLLVSSFLILRNYIGGFHASSHGKCILESSLGGVLSLQIVFCISPCYIQAKICLCILCLIINTLLGPIIHDEQLYSNKSRIKMLSIIISLLEIAVMTLLYNINRYVFANSIFMGFILAQLLYFIEYIKIVFKAHAHPQ